ncbi:MAG: hypothetical protein NTNFB02_00470 [Nitrospira sp.]
MVGGAVETVFCQASRSKQLGNQPVLVSRSREEQGRAVQPPAKTGRKPALAKILATLSR